MCKTVDNLIIKIRQAKLRLYLRLGATLINRTPYSKHVTVFMKDGKQVKSNPNREKDYKFDNPNWKVLKWK